MRTKIKFIPLMLALLMMLIACSAPASDKAEKDQGTYRKLTAVQAKEMIDANADLILLDVRTSEEYAEGHLPGALRITDTELEALAAEQLPDLDATLLVYCRSGRRSQASAELLIKLGYTQVYDIGGIADWPYEIVK